MLHKLKQLPELAVLPLLILGGLVFFAVTNPENLPPVALMIGFVILGGIFYCGARLTAHFAGLREKLSKGQYTATLVATTMLPLLLIALQSIGQLTFRDVITLAVLFLAGYLYVSRMTARR